MKSFGAPKTSLKELNVRSRRSYEQHICLVKDSCPEHKNNCCKPIQKKKDKLIKSRKDSNGHITKKTFEW